ncbi:hypothetical protein [Allonocardiopsis opalescens]|uniref:PH (Pleckstrin Homology) domain-containing protein n=1 Tax=Allonocardiopsis opalescens TaxID=1144618 RepID=A0A2T0QDY2_9ACTN|nr:hypothetical protein [Allonocardiopsis opalescens]PRY02147.1 hypothetical protein CLV72_101748 [Allonocardiopsis opalescens]
MDGNGERLRFACSRGRRLAMLVAAGVLAAAAVGAVLPGWYAAAVPAALAAAGLGAAGLLAPSPVLEVDGVEFRYTHGRYLLRRPFEEIGAYRIVRGRTRSLALYDYRGRPMAFPSLKNRRATRPYLPLTRGTRVAEVERFMALAGIAPRHQMLAADGD